MPVLNAPLAREIRGFSSALGMVLFILFLNTAIISLSGVVQANEPGVPYHRYVTAAGILYCFWFARSIAPILRNSWTYVLFMLFVSLSISWAQSPSDAFQVTRYFIASFVGALCAAVATGKNLRTFFQWVTPYFLIILVVSIYLCRSQPGVYAQPDSGRWLGITAHPNGLGAVAMSTIWCSLSLFVLSKSFGFRMISIAGIGAALICLKGSGSMTSIIASVGVATAFVYLLIVGRLHVGWRSLLVTASLLMFFSLAILLAVWPEALPVQQAIELVGRDTSFTGRTKLWQVALELFRSRPLLGWGFDHLRDVELTHGIQLTHLHNGYLDLLVRGGLVGITMVLSTMALLVVRVFGILSKDRIAGTVLAIGLIMILVHNVAEGSFGRGMNTLWLLYSFLFMHTSMRLWQPDEVNRSLSARRWNNMVA